MTRKERRALIHRALRKKAIEMGIEIADRKSTSIEIRVTLAQKRAIKAKAKAAGLSVSSYLLSRGLA